jgi:hypothetical protein
MSDKKPTSSLGLTLGDLPPETVDNIFAGLSWEAESRHGLSMRAAVVATFAAARVEAEMMNDEGLSVRDRLKAAEQFKSGFVDICKMVHSAPRNPLRVIDAKATERVPDALEKLYGEG